MIFICVHINGYVRGLRQLRKDTIVACQTNLPNRPILFTPPIVLAPIMPIMVFYSKATYYADHGILLQSQVSEQIQHLTLNGKLSTVDNQLSIKKGAYTKLA
jgi:hypothetical protein